MIARRSTAGGRCPVARAQITTSKVADGKGKMSIEAWRTWMGKGWLLTSPPGPRLLEGRIGSESLTLNPSPAGGRGTSNALSPLAQLLGEGPGVRDRRVFIFLSIARLL